MTKKLYFAIGRTENDEFDIADVQSKKEKLKTKEEYKKDSFGASEEIYLCEEIK